VVTCWKVGLQGTYYAPDEELMKSCKVNLNASRPEHTAVLYVYPKGEKKFRVDGWHYRDRPKLGQRSIAREKIGLAAFVEGDVQPRDIRGNVRSFSRQNPGGIVAWLRRLYDQYGEKLCVIVADHTDYELPWEMIELRDNLHLGAAAKVVRWTLVRAYDEGVSLQMTKEEVKGGLLAYLDSGEVSHMEQEQEALADFAPAYVCDMQRLKQRLAQSLQNVGLVYLGCHGLFTYSSEHERVVNRAIEVGALHNPSPSKHLTYVALEEIPLAEGRRPFFFVNACHSGRLLCEGDGEETERRFYGLPEILLARAASGYIGTMGPVGSAYAVRIAQQVLQAAQTVPDGVQLAEILQQLRKQAVQQLLADETSLDNWLRFIYTFMYVYYGNPMARLKLTRSVGQEEECEPS